MTAAVCLLGDYNNIFSIWKLSQRQFGDFGEAWPLDEVHNQNNLWRNLPPGNEDAFSSVAPGTSNLDVFEVLGEETTKHICDNLMSGGYGFGLKLGFGRNQDVKALVSSALFKEGDELFPYDESNCMTYLPGVDTAKDEKNGKKLFHRNKDGLIAFTNDECDRTSDYLASIDFEKRVKVQLQQQRFELPQEIGVVDSLFCNESVHGKAEDNKDHTKSQMNVKNCCQAYRRYLKATREFGLIMEPNKEVQLELYADAYFAGLWNVENHADPISVKSRTGYVILLGDVPVTWSSKLQTETATSTMHAEYIAYQQV